MSSDSDDDVPFKREKKSSGVRARRGFSRKLSSVSSDTPTSTGPISSSSAVYSTCVTKCFNSIRAKSIAANVKEALQDNDDVEDDITSICTAKPTVPVLKKTDTVLLSDDEGEDENSQDVLNTSSASQNTNMNANSLLSPSPPPPPAISVKSRKRRGGKKKKTLLSAVSVFNKQLYDAKSQLISTAGDLTSPEPEPCLIVDDDDEITVRVDIRSTIHRYILGRNEQLSTMIAIIAAEQQVPETRVMLVHRDRTLRPSDSPVSIRLNTADIIKCLIATDDQEFLNDSMESICEDDLIELVLQTRGSRHRDLIKTPKDGPMIVLMRKYVELMRERSPELGETVEETLGHLEFKFDGDIIGHNDTPERLDMDNGDIIDVNPLSVTVIS